MLDWMNFIGCQSGTKNAQLGIIFNILFISAAENLSFKGPILDNFHVCYTFHSHTKDMLKT